MPWQKGKSHTTDLTSECVNLACEDAVARRDAAERAGAEDRAAGHFGRRLLSGDCRSRIVCRRAEYRCANKHARDRTDNLERAADAMVERERQSPILLAGPELGVDRDAARFRNQRAMVQLQASEVAGLYQQLAF